MANTAPTLALYRRLIPAHAAVDDDVIEAFLEDAIEAHTASRWGSRYDKAMAYFAAHHIQRTPGMNVGTATAEESGALTTIANDNLQRTFATPRSRSPEEAELRTTRYGQLYLAARSSRAATAPFALGPG